MEIQQTFRSFRELDGWLTRSNWFILSHVERGDGTWDVEAISPMGLIVSFSSAEKDQLSFWSPKQLQVEVINDEDMPVRVRRV